MILSTTISPRDMVAAVAPVISVSMVDLADTSTWRIVFADHATGEQREAARAVLDRFDPLVMIKSDLVLTLNAEADQQRARKAVDPVAVSQARAILALSPLDLGALRPVDYITQFPALAAMIGAIAPTAVECATLIVQRAEASARAAQDIDRIRAETAAAIAQAADIDGAKAARAAVVWP